MRIESIYGVALLLFVLILPISSYAQMAEGAGDRYIRVAEIGELADSVNVWGDVGSSGRYIVPEETTIPELISFSFGYTQLRGNDTSIDWAKTQIEVKVSRYNKNRKMVEVALFRYRYHDPEPVEMFEFDLQNNDIVSVQVKRRPAFTDYVGVVAPVIGVVATSFLLIENLRGNR
jgi:hypothetical protein